MLRFSLRLMGTLALGASGLMAQIQPAPCNTYPILLVDAQGTPAPTTGTDLNAIASFALEEAYMSFANLPNGTHRLYVHVTDRLNGIDDQVLSTNDPADRIVDVVKTNGVVDLSLPFTLNQNPNIIVTLPDGNEILLITPVRNSLSEPCLFKAWMGNVYDIPSWFLPAPYLWPYIVRTSSTTTPCFSAYHYFRVGDSVPGSDVSGNAFNDVDRDGVRDPGEGPLVGWGVRLVTTSTTVQSVVTDANGDYVFPNVPAGNYTVEFVIQAGYDATRTSAYAIEVCGCANQGVDEFAAAPMARGCDARTIGFWRNRNGSALVTQYDILTTLPGLCLANANGTMTPPPENLRDWQAFLQGANSVNMAYMLSAQLAAMHCNVLAGQVDPNCRIVDPVLGGMTIHDLMQRAIQSLCNDGYTPVGDPNRDAQAALKNALDQANNNANWQ
jgi:hypothetical protein